MAIKKAIGSLVANLLKENIVCHFEVPSNIISDNGTPFLNKDVFNRMVLHFSHDINTLLS